MAGAGVEPSGVEVMGLNWKPFPPHCGKNKVMHILPQAFAYRTSVSTVCNGGKP